MAVEAKDITEVHHNAPGCWFVYYADWSGFIVFSSASEIDALRYAVAHHMEVMRLPFGVDPRDWQRELRRRADLEAGETSDG